MYICFCILIVNRDKEKEGEEIVVQNKTYITYITRFVHRPIYNIRRLLARLPIIDNTVRLFRHCDDGFFSPSFSPFVRDHIQLIQ